MAAKQVLRCKEPILKQRRRPAVRGEARPEDDSDAAGQTVEVRPISNTT
jgi:hypothetical protein